MIVAFTTTIPQEYIWAAGHVPLDLNNYFITGDSSKYIEYGEKMGMPRSTCSWIKGLLGVFNDKDLLEKIGLIIAVTEGDCSNNHGLINLYKYYFPNISVLTFSYPSDKNPEKLKMELKKLQDYLFVSDEAVSKAKQDLDAVRANLNLLDTIQDQKQNLPGSYFQKTLVSSTDFNGDYRRFNGDVLSSIQACEENPAKSEELKIGYSGVPCIFSDLFDYIENEYSAKVTYFEVEKDFSMHRLDADLQDQYLNFQYPYSVYDRIKTINEEAKKRQLDVIIYYAQSFCHRQLDSVIMQNMIDVPVLVVEGDAPGLLDMRTKIRIESFLETMLLRKKKNG